MKKEKPKVEKSLEEKFREEGYQIKKAQLSEEEAMQCDKCMAKDNSFQFYQEGWFIEGSFYCPGHKELAIKALEEVEKGVEKIRLEQEHIIEERKKQSGLK